MAPPSKIETKAIHTWQLVFACVGLALLTFATLSPVLNNEFIKFDDHQYVTENPHVLTGLTWANVKWAVRTGYASNWHPLTWVSHMCDVQLFDLRAGAHHLTNLLLHLANTVGLFLVLWRLTFRYWPSVTMAALFGMHPLHVESVAWVAERKDVLSTFFFLLTIAGYSLYAGAGSLRVFPEPSPPPDPRPARRIAFYVLALVLFALGLMCKPMLVTLPFLLLLLDWWPLGRIPNAFGHAKAMLLIAAEKIPFLLLTVLSSVATFYAQAGSHSITSGLPMRLRAANAIVSYLKYIGKTLWPSNLAIFYPHPDTRFGLPATAGYPASDQWPTSLVLAGLSVLVGLSCLAFWQARKRPWFFTGWFWFIGTLVPVIGLVQIGMQGMADRYAYIPSIGLFICLVWTAISQLQRRPGANLALSACGILSVACCAFVAHKQTLYWRTNFTVFEHALQVTKHNAVAECNVGEELAQQGKLAQAREHFRAAQLADPRYPLAYLDLGTSFELEGKLELAVPQFEATARLRPWNESARLRLAGALRSLGRRDDALAQYAEALKLNPDQPRVYYEMGTILAVENKLPEAIASLNRAVQLKPGFLEALMELGRLLAAQGKFTEAQTPLRQSVALCPTNATFHLELGKALMLGGKSAAAAGEFAEVIRLEPELPATLLREGKQFSSRGQLNEALVRFNTALWLEPDSPVAMDELAWILATHPLPQFRNGARALRLAQRALELSGGKEARSWVVLDAACAESGRFPDAIAAAQKARELALAAGDQQAAQACEARLSLYQTQRPFHQ